MHIYCKTCGVVLTKSLALQTSKTFNEEDGMDYIPQGYYAVSDAAYFYETLRHFICNVTDGINMKMHTMSSRLNGCCGMDGCAGINMLCENGHEVATQKSDCWMPHVLLFDNKKTFLK